MDADELASWLRLYLTPGVGPRLACKLLAAFGQPHQIFSQPPVALHQFVGDSLTEALLQPPAALPEQLARCGKWLALSDEDGVQRRIVPLGEDDYPPQFLHTEDPPLLLFLMGRLELLPQCKSSLAIVGSRNPTPQGLLNARQFSRTLSDAGYTIVSGLALGIDAAAHEGALEAAPGRPDDLLTLAVVGTGLDRVYPAQHRQLAHRIAGHGILLSEYLLGTPPLSENFPRRNRLISALSLGTLVVEAAVQSGSLITARLAVEQGKEVFAIPGSIHAAQSRGCHALIRQGAKLVESAQDILEELPALRRTDVTEVGVEPCASASDAPDPLFDALGTDPCSLDVLQARCGLAIPELQARLMALELEGHVTRLPGGLFQRLFQT